MESTFVSNGKNNTSHKNMRDPFLIDECLSPSLVAKANARGHHATHVVYRNLQGTKDPDLIPLIIDEDFVFVTNNGRDFLKLYSNRDIHPGLVIIVPGGLPTTRQIELFDLVLNFIENKDDLINRLIEVFDDGTVTMKEFPPSVSKTQEK